MKSYLSIIVVLFCTVAFGQNKEAYLKKNKWDVTKPFVLNLSKTGLVGFGAYHGSAKTEEAEIALITSLIENNGLRYYVAETDMGIANFLNEYLLSGDEMLLKDLIIHYGTRVPQERTVEVFEKWKKLKAINDKLPKNRKLTVLGPDPVVTYKYNYKLLLSLIKDTKDWHHAEQLQHTVAADTTDFSPYYDSFSKRELIAFVDDFESDKSRYSRKIIDTVKFDAVISLLKTSFGKYHREEEIYRNYARLYAMYNLKDVLVYARYGFFHIMKAKEGKAIPFFKRLLDNKLYNNENLVSIMGYFNESEVIWDDKYIDGEYSHSTTSTEGSGDSAGEYFRGIDALKKQKVSGLTLYKLDGRKSPYNLPGCTDLIEIITPEKSIIDYTGQTTMSFINYALLISNSKASRSIYTLP